MPIKQTVPTNSGDYLQFGNATTPVAAQVGGYEDSTGNGHLELYTTAGGTVTEQVRVTSAGNVGIGTNSPSTRLHVKGSSNTVASVIVENLNSTNGILQFGSTDSNYAIYGGSYQGQMIYNTGSATPHIWWIGGAEKMRIDSNGKVLIGTTSLIGTNLPYLSVTNVNGNAWGIAVGNTTGSATTGAMAFVNSNGTVGSILTSGSATSFNTSSDYRLKENIVPMTGALNTVALLKPVTYTWKVDGSDGQGFIAHELAEVVPDCVTGEKDAVDADGNPQYQGIDTSFLVATLTAALQEMKAIIDDQAARIAALEAK
jgi:hypothetical protein